LSPAVDKNNGDLSHRDDTGCDGLAKTDDDPEIRARKMEELSVSNERE
jgi:hypothetical protein